MNILKSKFVRKVGILGFSLTIAVVSILVINTKYNLLSQVGGHLAGSPLFIDNKFCDNPASSDQKNCASFIPRFISDALAHSSGVYADVAGPVNISGLLNFGGIPAGKVAADVLGTPSDSSNGLKIKLWDSGTAGSDYGFGMNGSEFWAMAGTGAKFTWYQNNPTSAGRPLMSLINGGDTLGTHLALATNGTDVSQARIYKMTNMENLTLTSNALYNGTNWTHDSTGEPGVAIMLRGGMTRFYSIPAGTGGQNALETMRIQPDGKIGIGTATPGRPLEVNNTMKFTTTTPTDANDGVIGVAGFAPGLNIVGVQTDGAGRKIYVWGYTTFGNGHGDLAENYFISGKVIRGSLVSINYSTPSTATAADSSHKTLLGIVTTNPGAVMDTEGGFHIGETTKPQYINEKTPIALVGTAPTLVTSQNGLISIGDPIGLSSLPGFGAKATTAGTITGRALEAFNPNNALCQNASSLDATKWPEDNGKNPAKPCFKLPDGTYIGKIMLAVNVTWYNPTTLDDTNISAKLDKQQQEIDQLKQEIQELKNK